MVGDNQRERSLSRSNMLCRVNDDLLLTLGPTTGTQTEPQPTNIHTLPMAPPPDPPIYQPQINYHQGELTTGNIEVIV